MTLRWLNTGDRGSARDFELEGSRRRVTGALWLPEDTHIDTPMVLMGHGASGDRYQAPIPHLARRFVSESGFPVLAIDGPVHGLREVAPGGREAFMEEMSRPGFTQDMVADWHDGFAAVTVDKGIGQGPLGYFGLSMGTILGLPLLASTMTFATSVIGLAGTKGAGKPVAEVLLDAAEKVDHPVLFLMQLEDELFPRDGYLALFDAVRAQDKRLHANPGLHPEIPTEEIDHAFAFLKSHLSGTVTRRITNPLAE